MNLKRKSLIMLVIFVTLLNSVGIIAFAQGQMNYRMMAEDMIRQYDEMMENPSNAGESKEINPLFTNDMLENQKKFNEYLQSEIKKAKLNNERLYSFDDILTLKATDIGIPEDDMTYIQNSIRNTVKEYEKLLNEFYAMGKDNHPLAVSINEILNIQLPQSLIYVDHSIEKADGHTAGGGWPYCLDDNGWGYKNFINSDCFWAYAVWGFCILDQSGSGMGWYWLRYCKTSVRNCSPLIFHSKYWHTH